MEDLKISLLNFSFAVIYIVLEMLVLLKNYMNYLQDNIFKCFFKKDDRILFHLKKYLFHNI